MTDSRTDWLLVCLSTRHAAEINDCNTPRGSVSHIPACQSDVSSRSSAAHRLCFRQTRPESVILGLQHPQSLGAETDEPVAIFARMLNVFRCHIVCCSMQASRANSMTSP